MTKRATPIQPSGPPPQSARDIRFLLDALEKLGYDRGSLIPAGSIRVDLNDPDALVPCETFGLIVRRAMEVRPMSNLAVHVASVVPVGAFPLLDYLVLTCDTAGDAVRQLARYYRLTKSPVTVAVQDREEPIRVTLYGAAPAFAIEFSIAIMLFHLRDETNGSFNALFVGFTHQPEDAAELERMFRCPVRSAADWNGFAISAASWTIPLRRRDPVLHGVLEDHPEAVANAAERQSTPADLASQLRRLLNSRVDGGDTRITAVAGDLGTTPRTLQRKLSSQGLSYHDLLDTVRRNAALRHLADHSLSITEIAYLLGYSEPSAFHRAFKRWYGITPEAQRLYLHAPD